MRHCFYFLVVALYIQKASSLTTLSSKGPSLTVTPAQKAFTVAASQTTTMTSTSVSESVSSTTKPPNRHRLALRQRCWNDQGFSVDCATWTGYYYTWGPPGNPYEGGPGEGGGGSGSGSGSGSGNGNPVIVSGLGQRIQLPMLRLLAISFMIAVFEIYHEIQRLLGS